MSPSEGYLEPGESRVCRVTFYAVGEPTFFDIDLVCEVRLFLLSIVNTLLKLTVICGNCGSCCCQVVNLALWESFERELNAWEEEKERRQVEFDCTESDPHHDRRVARITEDVRLPFIIVFYVSV